jgi:hypothetical protein
MNINNDIAKTMLSAAHELSLYIAGANKELRKKVNSQTETEPDWHDTQTCYELAQDSKRVEAMALRIKELESAISEYKASPTTGNQYKMFDLLEQSK